MRCRLRHQAMSLPPAAGVYNQMSILEFHVNGTRHRIETDPERTLLSVLRDDLDLTGSKYGCGEGRCGACTVLINGRATRSCITAVGDCADKQITTIEGL